MSTCQIAGCVSRGKHAPDCPDHCKHWPNPCPTRAGRPACDGHCAGCLPRDAFDPWVVCRWHGIRLGDALDELPRFLVHLHEIGKPYAQSAPPNGDTHGTPEGFANLPASWVAADEIESDALWVARAVLDDAWPVLHRRVTWFTSAPWDGDVVAWLTDHADTALCLPSALDSIVDLLSDIERAHYRWPTAEDGRPALALDLPCPRCGLRSLVRRPVMHERQTERIDCTDPDCARIFTREEYDRFAEMALRDGKMGKWRTEESA